MTEIHGSSAVVTGGGSGIGRAVCRALAAQGASVVVADILAENAQAVVDEITAQGGAALPVVCDVSDRASVQRAGGRGPCRLRPDLAALRQRGRLQPDPAQPSSPPTRSTGSARSI